MSLSELQRRNLIVKFCLENPNKSKSTVEHFKLLGVKIPTIYRTIKRFEKQEKVERKIGSGKKFALASSKVRAALSPPCELGWKIQVHHKTVKKYLTKMAVHRKAKNSAPITTAR
jgi:DeoR/GlpR family transcriptional regulator of sugar metabolism